MASLSVRFRDFRIGRMKKERGASGVFTAPKCVTFGMKIELEYVDFNIGSESVILEAFGGLRPPQNKSGTGENEW